jgi:hypothetical protein
MTDQELIDAVAIEVMGWEKIISVYDQPGRRAYFYILNGEQIYFDSHDFNPLTNANHWMMVVEKMKTKIFSFKIWAYAVGLYTVTFTCDIQGDAASYTVKNKSIGRAVCLAALKAVRAQ